MAVNQFQATAQLQEGVRVDVQSRQFSLTLDEPKELGGTDLGMNPVEALLGSLAACQAIVARVYAQKFDVQLDDFRVEVEGDIDLDGFFGLADVRPGYSEIRYRFHISSPSSQANIDALIAHLQQHCPVGDSLAKPVKLVLSDVVVNELAA
ncbi:MAG TPA: OsmC family protein [Alcanivoracaceae bacterium]|nr:OsmC family protein [Alcanivoracaceae bacterium]